MIASADIFLRAAEPEDLELAYALENDVAIWPCSSTNAPYSHYALKLFLENNSADIYADKQVRFAIDWKVDGSVKKTVGFVDLFNFEPRHHRAEIGLAIMRQFQGNKLGEKALVALEMYARTVDIHLLYAIISVQNKIASHTFEQVGFEPAARLRDWLWNGREYDDALVWSKIIDRDRENCRRAFHP